MHFKAVAQRALTALLVLAATSSACSQGKSYIVVGLRAQDVPIAGVARIRLQLSTTSLSDELTYAAKPGPTLELSPTIETTLSVSFTDAITGTAMLSATALDADGGILGYGENAGVTIAGGRVAYATVFLRAGAKPLERDGGPGDGGTGDGGDLADAGGPDASLLMCTPSMTTQCGLGTTCGLSCKKAAPTTKCVAAGTKLPGEMCAEGECAPGSQCFSENCGPKVCRRFCSTNSDCGAGSVCFINNTCGTPPVATGIRTCSQACDPRGAATTGCAAGLRCFLFAGEVVDCSCGSLARVGADGAVCADSGECMAGLLCVTMSGASRCRPICTLLDPGTCAFDRVCEKLTNPDYATFGACQPK